MFLPFSSQQTQHLHLSHTCLCLPLLLTHCLLVHRTHSPLPWGGAHTTGFFPSHEWPNRSILQLRLRQRCPLSYSWSPAFFGHSTNLRHTAPRSLCTFRPDCVPIRLYPATPLPPTPPCPFVAVVVVAASCPGARPTGSFQQSHHTPRTQILVCLSTLCLRHRL
ncbi:hypothetical protein LZ32DRAFT_378249 [Colletotrichum eremochloae]|nr:hypothetical protein LZ32DRAFT_378249 [Colletotrichum eremochloae]